MDELQLLVERVLLLAHVVQQREELEAIEKQCRALRERMELERVFALPDNRN